MFKLFDHMQKYTREVFAERLRKAGFSSYKGQDVHWFRLVNNEVIQAVYFVAFDAAPGTFAEILYGCHPLFVSPVFQKSPLIRGLPDGVQICNCIPEAVPGSTYQGVERFLLYNLDNNRPYHVPDSLIMCCPDLNYGLDVLEKLLSFLNRITTSRECYEYHKELRLRLFPPEFSVQSTYFVDEVLYWNDEEMYSDCHAFAKNQALSLKNAMEEGFRVPKRYRQSWEHGNVLNQVFEKGNFEEYLHTFQDRAQHNLRLLERNAGIQKSF